MWKISFSMSKRVKDPPVDIWVTFYKIRSAGISLKSACLECPQENAYDLLSRNEE